MPICSGSFSLPIPILSLRVPLSPPVNGLLGRGFSLLTGGPVCFLSAFLRDGPEWAAYPEARGAVPLSGPPTL